MKKLMLLFFAFVCSFLHANAQSPQWLWAKSAYGPENDWAKSVAIDQDGNVAITGHYFSEWLHYGPGLELTNTDNLGSADAFIVKYDPEGNVLWGKNAGGDNGDGGVALCFDASGNLYVTGGFYSSSITFGTTILTNTSEGSRDIFLVKYSPTGSIVWAQSYGGDDEDIVGNITVDPSGSVILIGNFESSSISFGTETLTNGSSGKDMFIVKHNSSGDLEWVEQEDGGTNTNPKDVKTDASGNVYVVGSFTRTTLQLGSVTLTNSSPGEEDVFLVKYNTGGGVNWAKSAVGEDNNRNDGGTALAIDGSNNIYITGYFSCQSITFGSITLDNESIFGSADIFLVKYDDQGTVLWGKRADAAGVNDIACGANGNIYLVGEFDTDNLDFGNFTIVNNGSTDVYLAQYNSSGAVVAAERHGCYVWDYGTSIAANTTGDIWVAGAFRDCIGFGTNSLDNVDQNDNTTDVYVAKYGVPSTSGISENVLNEMQIIPNPSSGNFTLSFNLTTPKEYQINIVDALGQNVFFKTGQAIGETKNIFTLEHLTSGIYAVQVSIGEELIRKNIIIVH